MNFTKKHESICLKCKVELEKIVNNKLLQPEKLKIFDHPRRILEANFPLLRDDGELEIIKAYRVLYNGDLGPGKGGIRFHEDVNLEEVAELAFIMSLKNSLVGLDFGGAKGGVAINPRDYSATELEKISRSYVREFFNYLGPAIDVPAPDVNTTSEIMGWMMDEYNKLSGKKVPAFITGKSLTDGGSEGRDKATAQGGFFIIEDRYKDKKKTDMTVAIQGFGNAGGQMAKFLFAAGYKVVAVSDSKIGIYDPNGLDIEAVYNHVYDTVKKRRLSELDGYTKISNQELLRLDVDLLVLAALGGVITYDNVDFVKAKEILELANGPVTARAEEKLLANGQLIIPDLLANAGGVIVSVFEWEQNLKKEHWTLAEVEKKLKKIIVPTYQKIITTAEEGKIDLRLAAHKIALARILKSNENTAR